MVVDTASSDDHSVNITYETLFDLLRVEKSRDEIQQLSVSFYQDVVTYLKKKDELVKKKEHESDIRDADELRKLRLQMENVHKLVKELFERREKKIIDLALNKARTQSDLVTTKSLLPEEMIFFHRVLSLLQCTREGVLKRLLRFELPHLQFDTEEIQQAEKASQKTAPLSVQGHVLVKFISPVPQFLGPSLEHHGPFLENEVANLPEKIASLLVEKQRAERM